MDALALQLKEELEYVVKHNKEIDTIFIGGGTPSAVESLEYEKIFKLLNPFIADTTEITTEANPNSATKSWLKKMHEYGVNRVSFGVQSFNDEKLKFLGRNHNAKRAITAIQDAKELGYDNINCDIIYGVKGDTKKLIQKDIDIIKSLPVNHVSAYDLTIEEGTKFYNKNEVKLESLPLAEYIFDSLQKAGFIQYEISNFAINEEAKSKHNIGYWKHNEYLGIGSGAVGYKDKYRYYPKKDIEEYILNPLGYDYEQLSDEDIKTEKILLGFRCCVGVDISLLGKKELKKINELVIHDKLYIKGERVYNNNYLLADELALYILG